MRKSLHELYCWLVTINIYFWNLSADYDLWRCTAKRVTETICAKIIGLCSICLILQN